MDASLAHQLLSARSQLYQRRSKTEMGHCSAFFEIYNIYARLSKKQAFFEFYPLPKEELLVERTSQEPRGGRKEGEGKERRFTTRRLRRYTALSGFNVDSDST